MFLLFIVLFSILLYYIQDKIYFKYWDKDLDTKLSFSPLEIIEGDKGQLIEVIKNAKVLPLSTLNIKFATSRTLDFINENNSITTDYYYRNDFFSVLGNKQVTRKLDFIATKRGYHSINKFDLCCSNIFLTNTFINSVDNSTHLYIFPKKIPKKDIPIPLEKIIGDYVQQKSLYEDPFEFKGLREYQPYDNISSINWKASAKSNSIMINQHNSTSSLKVDILLNCDVPNFNIDSAGEFSIKIAATICDIVSDYAIPIAFYCNSFDPENSQLLNVSSGSGPSQKNRINKALAKINLYTKTDNFANSLKSITDNNNLKIIISSDYRDEIVTIYNEFKVKNSNTIWIIPKPYNNEVINIANNTDILIWEVSNND